MLRLLPPVCRDCGKSSGQARLSSYLDFHLCAACVARRDREMMVESDGRRGRRVASAGEERAPTKRKAGAKSEAGKADGKPKKPAGKKKSSSRRPLKS